ncbi:MAG: molecular chaperone HtpG [Bacillota bacterium]|nr:molecular chaperone HtpG [Bacillota bacterium]
METRSGRISVRTDDIFPIIRQWLYSDRDIFLRELISNATDAISKHRRLVQLGEVEALPLPEDAEVNTEAEETEADETAAEEEATAEKESLDPSDGARYRIDVTLDRDAGTLVVSDNGIGMTADELDKYINQIAFSGAVDFVERYREKGAGDDIIGHFGLGFYSVFMVADRVVIETRSALPDTQAARWISDEGTDFTIEAGSRETNGSDIILHLNEEAKTELDAAKIREILRTYSSFMPYVIYFTDVVGDREAVEAREERFKERHGEWENRRREALDKGESFDEAEPERYPELPPRPVNETRPLWLAAPREVTEEQYRDFYRDTFLDYREPLFWIHLNMDYPFRVQGILYFPQSEHKYETLDGRIKIYSNQVFVADNIPEIIPDFLFLLKGCLDMPDLPLNVSRSFLQNDRYVRRLSDHIVRKVADRLTSLFEEDCPAYEKYWRDIAVFVKYGCLRDEKFFKRVKSVLLFEKTDGSFATLEELGDTIRYANDPKRQVAYVSRLEAAGNSVVILDHELDNAFISLLEHRREEEDGKLRFVRVDAEVAGDEGLIERQPRLEEIFRRVSGQEKLGVVVRAMGEAEQAAVLLETEESRRMQDMRRQFERMDKSGEGGMDLDAMFPVISELVVNTDSPLVSRIVTLSDLPGEEAACDRLAHQVYDLARLAHGSLTGSDLAAFLRRSTELLGEL